MGNINFKSEKEKQVFFEILCSETFYNHVSDVIDEIIELILENSTIKTSMDGMSMQEKKDKALRFVMALTKIKSGYRFLKNLK